MFFKRCGLGVLFGLILAGWPLLQGAELRFHRAPGTGDEPKFLGSTGARSYVLRADGFSFLKASTPAKQAAKDWETYSDDVPTERSYDEVAVWLEGANSAARASGLEPTDGVVHYIRGGAAEQHTGLSQFERVRFHEVYAGIDIEYYGAPGGMEYDFVVAPGADPRQIRFAIESEGDTQTNSDGDLLVGTGDQEWRQSRPVAYQLLAGNRELVWASYSRLEDGSFGIELGEFDPERELVIDPVVFSRQFPGERTDRFLAVELDENGFIYTAGLTFSSDATTVNALQGQRGGDEFADGYIVMLTPDGEDIAFATYLGGSGADEVKGIAVDPDGFIYVAGATNSPDFPTTDGAYQRTLGGESDMFVAKLTPDGSELVYSTYIGTAMRDVAERISVDADREVLIAGSSRGADFPTTPGASQPTFGGGDIDVVVLKLDALGEELIWSTFYGGGGSEVMQDLEVDNFGRAVVTGETSSDDLPSTLDAPQPDYGGGVDAYVAVLGPASELLYSTYLGGETADRPFGVAFGLFDSILVTGGTSSPNFPVGDSGEQPLEVDPPTDGFLTALPAPAALAPGGAAARGAAQGLPGGPIGPLTELRTYFDRDFGFNVGRDVSLLRESAQGSVVGIGVSFELDAPGTRLATELEVFPLEEVYGPAGALAALGDGGVRQTIGPSRRKVKRENQGPQKASAVRTRTRVRGDARVGLVVVGDQQDDSGGDDGGIVGIQLKPELAISKRITKGSLGFVFPRGGGPGVHRVAPSSTVEFEIVIENVGDAAATGLSFLDRLPEGWDARAAGSPRPIDLSATQGIFASPCDVATRREAIEIECAVGDTAPGVLQPGGKVVLVMATTTHPITAPGVIKDTNSVCTWANNANVVCSQAEVVVLPSAGSDQDEKVRMGVSLVRDPVPGVNAEGSPQQTGGRARILIGVENPTDAEVTGVRVQSNLPLQLKNARIVNGHNICRIFPGLSPYPFRLDLLTCRQEVLRARTRMDIAVEGDLPLGRTRITAGAKLLANDLFPSPQLASDSKIFGEEPAADLRTILNLDGPATQNNAGGCRVCQQARVTVANNGMSSAGGTTATVRRGVGGLTFANPGAMCTTSDIVSCDFGELASGDSISSTFDVCLPCERAGLGAAVLNASTSSSVDDPNEQNNFNRLVYRPSAADNEAAVVINPGGVIDTAKFGARGLAPGSDPSLFGSGLADELAVATSLPLPTTLGGVSIEVNGFPAPLIFVSPNQINFQTPWEIADQEWVDVVVRKNGEVSDPERVFVTPFDPGLFSLNQTGSGQGAILIAGTAVVPAPEDAVPGGRPARAGEFLSLFAVGLGPVENQPLSGAVAPVNPFATTKLTPRVTIGGLEAQVLFSGLAPGLAGVYQVNAGIPEGVATGGAVEVQMTIGGVTSNTTTIAIGP